MRLFVAAVMIALLSGCAAFPSASSIEVLDRHTGDRYNCVLDSQDPLGGYCAPAAWPRLPGFPWDTTAAQ